MFSLFFLGGGGVRNLRDEPPTAQSEPFQGFGSSKSVFLVKHLSWAKCVLGPCNHKHASTRKRHACGSILVEIGWGTPHPFLEKEDLHPTERGGPVFSVDLDSKQCAHATESVGSTTFPFT